MTRPDWTERWMDPEAWSAGRVEINIPPGEVPLTHNGERVGSATFEVPSGTTLVYLLGSNGAWIPIGTAESGQFETRVAFDGATYATLHTEPPEQVSGGSPAYARRDINWGATPNGDDTVTFTATFDFDPGSINPEALRALYGGGSISSMSRLDADPVTYLEETPEGDIVERIGSALEGWEHWHDAMEWTAESDEEDPFADYISDRVGDALVSHYLGDLENWRPTGIVQQGPWRGWREIGFTEDLGVSRGLFQAHPARFERVTDDTRARAQRALAEWEIRRGMIFDLPERIREALNTDPGRDGPG